MSLVAQLLTALLDALGSEAPCPSAAFLPVSPAHPAPGIALVLCRSQPGGTALPVIPLEGHKLSPRPGVSCFALSPTVQPLPYLLPALSPAKHLSFFFLILKFLASEPSGLLESGLPDGPGGR